VFRRPHGVLSSTAMSTPDPGRHVGPVDEIPDVGSVIADKYEVERVLGSGGMGVVVAARHVQLGQRVAIKFMRTVAAANPDSVTRFLREAQAAVALTSDHVTRVLDVGTLPSGAPFMVMEHLVGRDLAEHLAQNGPMPIVDAVDAVMQASEAIAEAHARGIIHRDLKPSNLFLTRRIDGAPFVKVLDFGISKSHAASDINSPGGDLTGTGFAMGSPGYMSPEQVRNAKAADPRSDIWSLGVILYQLLTGIAPFAGETVGDTFAKIVSEDPVPIRQHRPEVPEGLAQTIAQCLERRATRRVQTVAQLAILLARFGKPDAAAAAQRVVHISRSASGAPTGQETIAAPPPEIGRRDDRTSSASRPPEAWQHSNAVPAPAPPASRMAWTAVVSGVAITLVVVALGVRSLRRPPAGNESRLEGAAASVSQPLTASAPVQAPPVDRRPPLGEREPGTAQPPAEEPTAAVIAPLVASADARRMVAPSQGAKPPARAVADAKTPDAGTPAHPPRKAAYDF
jgi:serine/threonine protein kinase